MEKRKQLKVQSRKVTGKKVRKLREAGILPANVYGTKIESQAVQTDERDFMIIFRQAGETEIFDLKVGREELRPVLIHEVQRDPVTSEPLHVDFLQVDLKEKVTVEIPLEFTGESPAVKQGKGILLELLTDVEVEALPTQLPSRIELDISSLTEVDDAIWIKDLSLPEGVQVKLSPDELVCKIEKPRVEEEVPERKEPQVEESMTEGEENKE